MYCKRCNKETDGIILASWSGFCFPCRIEQDKEKKSQIKKVGFNIIKKHFFLYIGPDIVTSHKRYCITLGFIKRYAKEAESRYKYGINIYFDMYK